ncbi:MAG: NAD-dependent epimerase/dehydratase family protein [Bacteroidaceae bacterium]|nr:NAD-dependent epimerase/dehydratase family protein [Bacteroidaceae bacterium]
MNKSHPLYQEDLANILAVKDIEQLRGKRFLITGATGLIGVQLIDALMRLGDVDVIAVGRSRDKAAERLGEYFDNPHFTFLEHDITKPFNYALCIMNYALDYIIPLASHTHPLAYSQYPVETIMINVKGAEHALDLAQQTGATVLYPSTVEVYGNAQGDDVFTEDYTGMLNLKNARSCYPESKRVSEALCQSYMAEKGVKVKIVRLSRVFGPTMLPSDTKASSQFIQKAIAGEDIVLKSKGEQYFSYTYVADAVAAMLHVLLHGEMGVPYNISNEACDVHLREFAAICAECAGKEVVFDLPSETEAKGFSIATKAILDDARLKGIGFVPRYTIRDAIQRTIEIVKSGA